MAAGLEVLGWCSVHVSPWNLLINAALQTWPTGAQVPKNERIFIRSVAASGFPSFTFYQVQLRVQKATTTAGFRAQLIRENSRKEARNTSSKIQPVAADRPEFSCRLLFFFYCPSLPPSSADIRRKRLQGLLETRLHLLHLLWLFAAASRAGANRVISGYGNTF